MLVLGGIACFDHRAIVIGWRDVAERRQPQEWDWVFECGHTRMDFSESGPERRSSLPLFRPDQAGPDQAGPDQAGQARPGQNGSPMLKVAAVLVHWVQRTLIEPARLRRRRRARLEALMSLSAHLLADLGLARGDVQAALWGDLPLGPRHRARGPIRRHDQDLAGLQAPRQSPVLVVVERDRMDSAA